MINILESQPTYDVRNLLHDTEYILADLISDMNQNPAYLLGAVPCLRLPKATRARISGLLRKARTRNMLYSLMLCEWGRVTGVGDPARARADRVLCPMRSAGSRVVSMVQTKERPLHPSDLLLVINFVTNAQSLRSAEAWAPICLPKFNDTGFLYAYVHFIGSCSGFSRLLA